MEISTILGDITKLTGFDVIVNAANKSLLGGGGVDGAIHRAAGPELFRECATLNGCQPGKAKVTAAYNLPMKNVIHTVGPVWHGGQYREEDCLASCYNECLRLATELKAMSIVFPSISTGVYMFPKDKAAKIAARTIKQFLDTTPTTLEKIAFAFIDQETKSFYDSAISEMH